MTPEYKVSSGIPNGNGANAVTRWWPVILFVIIQLFTTGVMYERLVQVEGKVTSMVPRTEWNTVNEMRADQIRALQREQESVEAELRSLRGMVR